ncbi:response regulator [Patescibacteria group bacterium]|nr:response regulator [Patescibacteria group bacterium]
MAKILVVDDEKAARELLSKLLTKEGHKVIEAADGDQALKTVYKEWPDAIIMDAILPGMSVIGVVEMIRADFKTRKIPVLMVTAYEETKAGGIRAGIDDFIVKPFEPEELLNRVRAMLKIKDIGDELQRTLTYAEELSKLREKKVKEK